MIILVIDKTEGSPDGYGDPTITWTGYEIEADTLHPYRQESLRLQDYGMHRRTMYQLTFDPTTENLEHVEEGNRFQFFGDQFSILIQENWTDSLGNVVRVYAVAEKCVDKINPA